MAGSSLLMLLDDIAAVLDDVALMTKVAAKKTAGVLGDDLALNAQQVSGVRADRELPVVWAVAKGSFRNKLILVPAALAISAFVPWAVTPLLMVGGAFLCFEGFEKLAHSFMHNKAEAQSERQALQDTLAGADVDLAAFEECDGIGEVLGGVIRVVVQGDVPVGLREHEVRRVLRRFRSHVGSDVLGHAAEHDGHIHVPGLPTAEAGVGT